MAIILGTSLGDRLRGGLSADTIRGFGGNDFLSGLGAIDTIFGGAGDDTISGGDGNDTLDGESGNDTLRGDKGKDTLRGGGGKDTLDGGLQGDKLFGDAGNDTLLGATGDGADQFNGGAGIDTVDYSKVTGSVGVQAYLNGLAAGLIALGDTFNSIENVIGTKNIDAMIGTSGSNRLEGGAGHDTLAGGMGADTLLGGDGDDVLMPGGDLLADVVNGGDGLDRVLYADATAGVVVNLISGAAGGAAVNDTFTSIEWVIGSELGDVLTAGLSGIASGGSGDDNLSGSSTPGSLTTEKLVGDFGDDTFVLHRFSGADVIIEFVSKADAFDGEHLQISAAEFAGVTYGGDLLSNAIVNNVTNGVLQASRASAQFIFDETNQTLYFDADGTLGVFSPEVIAIFVNHAGGLNNGGLLTGISDFLVL